MTNSEIAQQKIDEHLRLYNLVADHQSGQVMTPNGDPIGSYSFKEGDDNPDDNSVTVNFDVQAGGGDVSVVPTLTIKF
jgi:hypothetical protein